MELKCIQNSFFLFLPHFLFSLSSFFLPFFLFPSSSFFLFPSSPFLSLSFFSLTSSFLHVLPYNFAAHFFVKKFVTTLRKKRKRKLAFLLFYFFRFRSLTRKQREEKKKSFGRKQYWIFFPFFPQRNETIFIERGAWSLYQEKRE